MSSSTPSSRVTETARYSGDDSEQWLETQGHSWVVNSAFHVGRAAGESVIRRMRRSAWGLTSAQSRTTEPNGGRLCPANDRPCQDRRHLRLRGAANIPTHQ